MADKIVKIDPGKVSVHDLKKTTVLPLPPTKISMPPVKPPKPKEAPSAPKNPLEAKT
jgi:hypothetical protein